MPFIVAIDGPAGTGKGTITKLISQEMGLLNVDTGALYRCVALACLRKGLRIEEEKKISELVDTLMIEIKNRNGEQTIFLNGEDVTMEIRSKEVTNIVSFVSSIIEVRLKITELERAFGKENDIIMEGRDIGTYVFPNADVKFYLDATSEERAKRRVAQNQEKGISISFEEVLQNIITRDENDKNKKIGALKIAEDAIVIDTTAMTITEVKQKVKEIIQRKKEENK